MKFPCQVILFVLFNLFLPVNETFGQIASGEAVYFNSTAIKGWAVKCIVRRGYVNISDKSAGRASAGDDVSCLGRADNITVSLGDSGYAVVGFSEPVFDIEGDDFAVFENSFDGRFLEFAFVEASTDSIRWVRFPARSLIQTDVQTGAFGLSDPQLIHNLAGKYPAYYGTPFDLAVLRAIRRDMEQGQGEHSHLAAGQGVSINLSAPSIVNANVVDAMLALVRSQPGRKIVIEITETALITQMDKADRKSVV